MTDVSEVRPMFAKVLVANRGEIAVRVMRTCREMGIPTVAVFSEPDRHSQHVRYADEAFLVGPAPSSESYLVIDRILEVARSSGADAIHPGYGFLSENADFAQRCQDDGITFIGPSPDAIRAMGDKTAARALMEEAGVPMAPGTTGAIRDEEEALAVAEQIGYPVLIKAAAGGGGKGMRVVNAREELPSALRGAQGEAGSAFADSRVFVEKFIQQPRHIEFQLLGDKHGNYVHLFERECSIQRRHQKVIEEAPSAVLSPELRATMGEAAIEAAKSVDYFSAGTVEFLVDESGAFYFMEMNTRLQVEHPVTELITGVDLVAEQLRIAAGMPLRFKQEDLSISGHAIECRIYAEDPANQFLPDPGTLVHHRLPSGPGVRVDTGVAEGDEVPIYYDPMISKLSASAEDRDRAIDRMTRALDEYQITGVRTTIPFCRFAINHAAFRSGKYSTQFVEEHFTADAMTAMSHQAEGEEQTAAAIAAALSRHTRDAANSVSVSTSNGSARDRWHTRRELR
ncbi:MAG: acetyl-CoA carboxylase biotin carboxylase subunit [Rhodothermales bacterium]|nr:acetyl-CoA carboxylase biotin carboxylase subunit [Rhodothermales bacterium]